MSTEWTSDDLQFSPFVLKFAEMLRKASKDEDSLDTEYLLAEFRGWPLDPDPYTVFFKRKGREYWVLDYRNPRVALYRVRKRKYKDEDTGEEVEEEVAVHDRTVFNFVPVEIREFHDFTLELAAEEANMDAPPTMYQWVIAERSLSGVFIRELRPAITVEILDKLSEIGGLYLSENLAKEAVHTILTLARTLEAIEHVHRPLAPGIYWNPRTQELEAYGFDTKMPSRVQVLDALKLLDKIVRSYLNKRWFESWPVKFGKILKWALVAGLGYAYKVYNEKRRWLPYLLFVGESMTGKTQVISKVITYIWAPVAKFTSIGSSWSVYNFGEVISSVASLIVLNESAPLFRSLNYGDEGDNFFNLIKSAPEQYLFRTRAVKGVRRPYPALATLAFNANMPGIRDEAIRRRFFTIEFTKVDKIPLDVAQYFERNIVPYLDSLSAIGRFVFNVVKENPELLRLPWQDLAEELVRRLYEYAMLEVPEWLRKAELVDNYCEELEEEKREVIVTWLRKHFDEIYFRYSRYADSSTTPKDRIYYVLEHELSPYFLVRGGELIIKKTLLDALRADTRIDVYSFKALCELFGWEYKARRLGGTPTKVGITPLKSFLELLGVSDAPVEADPRLAEKVVDILAMGRFTFDELMQILSVPEEELREVIEELERNMVILPRDGRYSLNRSRARELGFDVVDSYVVAGGGKP
ncbi:hypothetical protein [Thermococcus sp.]|uniref:hypothetical protein n=1 Tax=Thermococcus sp. TaxID=35749 RepID=UPI0026169716|nr:hypothetical protein [Thermococcus sp.]